MKLIPTLFTFLVFNFSFAQQVTFEKHYNFGATEEGYCVQQTYDGGYIIAGRHTLGIGNEKMLLHKTDSLGQTEWVKFIGSPYENQAYSVKQTTDSGYILCGYTTDVNYKEYIYLVKTNSNGDTLWTKNYFPPVIKGQGMDVVQTFDGGFFVLADGGDSTDTISSAIYLIRADSNGDTIWTRKYKPNNGNIYIAGYSFVQTIDSGFIVGGSVVLSPVPNFTRAIYLIKTNLMGDTLWTKILNVPSSNGDIFSVCQTSDSGYFISGEVEYPANMSSDIYLIKTNSIGDSLWTRVIGGQGVEGGPGQQTKDGGYIISSITTSYGIGSTNVYLVKTDQNGDTLWTKVFGGSLDNVPRFIQQTKDEGYIIAGMTTCFGSGDVYLIKTDIVGNLIIGIEGLSSPNNQLIIYPNPFSTSADIILPERNISKNTKLVVFDLLGKIIEEESVSSKNIKFQRNGLPNGLYTFQLIDEMNIPYYGKFIVQ